MNKQQRQFILQALHEFDVELRKAELDKVIDKERGCCGGRAFEVEGAENHRPPIHRTNLLLRCCFRHCCSMRRMGREAPSCPRPLSVIPRKQGNWVFALCGFDEALLGW
jgi:hypothetical protein